MSGVEVPAVVPVRLDLADYVFARAVRVDGEVTALILRHRSTTETVIVSCERRAA